MTSENDLVSRIKEAEIVETKVRFGTLLRAYRNRFYYVDGLGVFIRMYWVKKDLSFERIAVEIATTIALHRVADGRKSRYNCAEEYIEWTGSMGSTGILSIIKCPRPLNLRDGYENLLVDGDGNVVD